MQKKKIIFLADTLDIGGIEQAVLNYLKLIDREKYQVSLMLNQKVGIYLKEVPNDVEIIDFRMSTHKNIFVRKIVNALKLLYFSIRYYHQFDFAACFATVIKSCFVLAKRFSSNNAIWIHGEFFETVEEGNKFLKYINASKYKKVVFVSERLKENYLKVRPNTHQELYVLNNLVDALKMLSKSEENIELEKEKLTFLNVSRHEDHHKRLGLLLKCCARLLKEGYDFDLWLVGAGPDTKMYQDLVSKLKITSNVKFLGKKSNVFPYYKKCDAVLISSIAEGNPVVFLEAKVLGKPIISTNVSDAKTELAGYGIVTDFSLESYYQGLKEFLDHGYQIKKKFNASEYNKNNLKMLDKVIGDI